ncbi:TetR/AcrR family transcriptional regulator C-terminal ligand-binding domain-containing protein [Streptomyces sp. NPDC050597]|uniref:TetR/AcrR family transcriptional regulator n=1 Tax=Streptomyces sp. NPDC050597 TaxID=3157212 RepID=UPI0034226EDB
MIPSAKRADVGKSAIYRRWPSKLEMIVAGLVRLSTPIGPAPDTGSLRGDVRAVMQAAFDWLSDPRIRAVLPDLIAESDRNAVLAEAVAKHVTGPRVTWAHTALHRARDRGEPATDDVDLVLDLTIAPVFWRLTHDRPVDGSVPRPADRVDDGCGAAERRLLTHRIEPRRPSSR